MEHRYDTPAQAWLGTVKLVLENGERYAPRDKPILEVRDRVHLRIIKPWMFPLGGMRRNFKHVITAAEGLSLVGQTSVPELITDRVKAFRPFLNHSVFWGAYGPRAAGDVANVVELLKRDPDSRQAVISLYDSDRDLGRPEVVDVPCTMTIQFLLRGQDDHGRRKLEMWVAMRSNDAWLGLPYDLGQFILLQSAIANALDVSMGVYTHSAGSMHLYERDWEKAEAVDVVDGGYYLPMVWGSSDIGEISSRARRILLGQELVDETPLERWLASALAGKVE